MAEIAAFLAALFVGILHILNPAISYFSPPSVPAHAEIVFGGDMMFDRTVRREADIHGGDFLFSCLTDALSGADIVVANLEGPITVHPSISLGSVIRSPENYTFTFPTSTAELLARHNIRLVNIGNNHIMNFGREGLVETKEWLEGAGVAYMGDPSAPERERVARLTIGGIAFSFVNWSDWTSDKTDHTVAQVREEAESGRVPVVYAHWGEEYMPPLERVKALARQFVDAGAAIVVGSHPHIVQERELYQGRYIYYSLGNFFFDQYWREDVSTGLLISAVFDERGVVSLTEIPIELQRDRRTCPISTPLSVSIQDGQNIHYFSP
jgi:poly-gamma-glutamate synthesis protein (capsule biosynthesis protein)